MEQLTKEEKALIEKAIAFYWAHNNTMSDDDIIESILDKMEDE